jgi:hypothetical protein
MFYYLLWYGTEFLETNTLPFIIKKKIDLKIYLYCKSYKQNNG